MVLASQLKKLMNKHDLTVAKLSRVTGVSRKTLHSWIDGNQPKNLTDVKSVADYFDVSLDYFLFNVTKHDKKISIEDVKEEISLGVLELIVRRPKTGGDN